MTERTTIAPAPPGAVGRGAHDLMPVEAVRPVGVAVRLAAYLLDALIVSLAIYLVAVALRAVAGPTIRITDVDGVPRLSVDRLRSVVDSAAATTVAGTYFVASWLGLGGTPMQRLVGARVERADGGGRLHARQAMGRWFLLGAPFGLMSTLVLPVPLMGAILSLVIGIWYAILFVTTALDRRKRGLHDRVTGSMVRRRPGDERR